MSNSCITPTLALALETSRPPLDKPLQERQQMKFILGATLLFIALWQLKTWIQTQPILGIPLAIILAGIWIWEVAKEINARRR